MAPEKIENIYSRSPYVQQVYVDGDSLETFLIAIVVPEPAHLQQWYKSKFGKDEDIETICELDQVGYRYNVIYYFLGKRIGASRSSGARKSCQIKWNRTSQSHLPRTECIFYRERSPNPDFKIQTTSDSSEISTCDDGDL